MCKILPLLLLLSGSTLLFAQKVSKKPLDHSVYDTWQSVTNERISNDGKWIAYVVRPQQADADLVITGPKNNNKITIPRADTIRMTDDSKYAVFLIRPFYKDTRMAKIKKKKPEDFPKDSLGFVTLGNGMVTKVPAVRSFKMADKASVIAYLVTPKADTAKRISTPDSSSITPPPVSATTMPTAARAGGRRGGGATSLAAAANTESGDLIVLNLTDSKQRTFKSVTDYQLSKDGKQLTFVMLAAPGDKPVRNGVYIYDTGMDVLKQISFGRGTYRNLVFDDAGKQLAFTAEKFPLKALVKPYRLYYYTMAMDSAEVIASKGSAGMKSNWAVSGDGRVYFSKKGSNLFFGTAPIPKPADTTIVDFEVAKVDIWNYKDDYLQPQQLRNVQRELKRSYLAVRQPGSGTKTLVQLGDPGVPEVYVADNSDAPFVLGVTDTGYRRQAQWEGGSKRAAFVIDTKTGERTRVTEPMKMQYNISPGGNYIYGFDSKTQGWYTYHIGTKKHMAITGNIPVKFGDELNDVPDDPQPYGVAAWTEDDKAILINDRYDIWSIDPETGKGVNFTNGIGRRDKVILRYENTDPEQKFISAKQTVYLLAQNEENKQWGYYSKPITSSREPEKIMMAPYQFSAPLKARNSEAFVYTKASYELPPDLFFSNTLKTGTKLSAINPQQSQYNWGTAELVKWTTTKGHTSKGILYKPEDFDPAKKYPMIVYFYEKLSEGLYNYIPPAPTPSRLNIPFFVSRGYLVFTPDISYETGYPGPSAIEYINSGVQELEKNSWVDAKHVGLQGQSWGGYQVAYLITQTNMYAAAWAGAPVANMTSAYGGIRWETGVSREFQYEKTQSRIGASLWEKPELYIQNSPLFQLPKVQTPVMIMSNDADGAVPWYQGIEMFSALRRLNKPVWLLQYNGEAHNLVLRQNRKDIQVREQQFFDHYLKGAPMPVWMAQGVPATDKGKEWGFELDN